MISFLHFLLPFLLPFCLYMLSQERTSAVVCVLSERELKTSTPCEPSTSQEEGNTHPSGESFTKTVIEPRGLSLDSASTSGQHLREEGVAPHQRLS